MSPQGDFYKDTKIISRRGQQDFSVTRKIFIPLKKG